MLLPLLIGAGVFFVLVTRSSVQPNAPLGTVKLYKGVPYQMTVRLDLPDTTPAGIAAREQQFSKLVLGAGHAQPIFSIVQSPPFWATAGSVGWSPLRASFRVVPTVTDTTGIGSKLGDSTLEAITRLDGRDFAAPPTTATA